MSLRELGPVAASDARVSGRTRSRKFAIFSPPALSLPYMWLFSGIFTRINQFARAGHFLPVLLSRVKVLAVLRRTARGLGVAPEVEKAPSL